MLGYGRQTIDQSDVDAVIAALTSDFLTQGPAVTKFEAAVAAVTGARFAVAVSSATAALHVACLAAGAKAGTKGVTQPLTFVASANCLVYCGAEVGLVDIDPDTLMMCPQKLATHLKAEPDVSIVIPVSFGGLSSNGSELREVCGPNRIIIEDASHAYGATDDNGAPVGSAGWADMTIFSFHPVKPITTGEGGMIVTDNPELYRLLCLYRSHGIERDPNYLQSPAPVAPWWYEQQVLGYNYRLSDIQAALGANQAPKIGGFLARRREIAQQYDAAFSQVENVQLYQSAPSQRARSGHHVYIAGIDYTAIGKSRSQVMQELRGLGVGSQVHYIPVYTQPYYAARFPNGAQDYPITEAFYEKALTIPCFPTMSDDDVMTVINAIKAVVGSKS
jgi:perosamine synthetase